jgi:hypothetical protein
MLGRTLRPSHEFKKLAKRAIKACLGVENSSRVRHIYDRTRFGLYYLHNYKLIKKHFDILFFCPIPATGWRNIKPVVEELIRRRDHLRLGIVNWWCSKDEFPDSFYLTGNPAIINHRGWPLGLFDTRILYTPWPGMSPFDRPPKARVVHALMSMNSLDGVYPDDDFDAYDYIFCIGPHHLDSFRERALRHPALLGKTLVPAGYPKLDLMLASNSTKRHRTDPSLGLTVVYAPTHVFPINACLASLFNYGEAIVNALLAEGHRVIFRPHPNSLVGDQQRIIDRICRLHTGNPNFALDTSKDYSESYALADLMVTDLSGTGFTFSVSFGRPCIFFSPNEEAEHGLRGIQFDARHRIGTVVRGIDELIEKISELCNLNMTDEIEQYRDEAVFNVGNSAKYIVDCLEDILSGCERPEWVRL